MAQRTSSFPSVAACRSADGAIALAACAFAAQAQPLADAPARVLLQLTPAQDFTPSDGRAMDVPAWRIDKDIAARAITRFNPAQPLVIDYEHQTLNAEANGQPAPAAGWIHALRWVEGRGLFAEAELTERARQMVAAGEYRFFSPVFEYDPGSGTVLRVLMGALTNHPAIHGMQAVSLAAAATARFATTTPNQPPENTVTLLEQLLAAFGLPATTTEEAAIAACKAAKAQADAARAALQLADGATAEAVTAACTSLRAAKTAEPDPAKFVPVAVMGAVVDELKASIATLSAQQHARATEDVIAPALADGRLLPAEEAWARDTAQTPAGLASLSALLKVRQPIAALSGTQTQGKPPAQGDPAQHGLSAAELAVAAACGLTPEAYAKGKA